MSFSKLSCRCRRLELEVVPAALHVPVVRVEQAPGAVALGVGPDRGRGRRRSCLGRLGDPIGFEQDLGGCRDQRPVRLDAGKHLGPEPRLPGLGECQQLLGGLDQQPGLDLPEQRPLDRQERLNLGEPVRREIDLGEPKLGLDLPGRGDVALPHIPPEPPGPRQVDARLAGGGLHGDLDRGQRGRDRVPKPGDQIGHEDVAGQPRPEGGQWLATG